MSHDALGETNPLRCSGRFHRSLLTHLTMPFFAVNSHLKLQCTVSSFISRIQSIDWLEERHDITKIPTYEMKTTSPYKTWEMQFQKRF